jgi:hypothetical protein
MEAGSESTCHPPPPSSSLLYRHPCVQHCSASTQLPTAAGCPVAYTSAWGMLLWSAREGAVCVGADAAGVLWQCAVWVVTTRLQPWGASQTEH